VLMKKFIENRPDNVLLVAPSAYPMGGVAVWLNYLILGLEDQGWMATLGLTSGLHHNVQAYREAYPNINNVIQIHNTTGSREGRVRSLVRVIKEQKPDLVICINIPDVYEAINRIREKTGNAPRVVMAIHSLQPDHLDDLKNYRNVLDGVICTNRLTMKLSQQDAGLEESKIFYAPYGVDQRPVWPEKKLPNGKLRIAWVGRFDQFQKHIWDVPEIIKELINSNVDFELLIAGTGLEESTLLERLEREQLSKYAYFIGLIPPEEMQHRVYDVSDVLLVTSYWETGPIIIWEAMSSGVPVVSSKYIGSGFEGGLVDGQNCLLFEIGDVESAAMQIKRLHDQELYLQLIAGGHELIDTRYNKKVSVLAWHAALKNVLDKPSQQSASLAAIAPAGKLDKLLGTSLGEYVRSGMGISYRHTTAGGEWPHSYGGRQINDEKFWGVAFELDKKIPLI